LAHNLFHDSGAGYLERYVQSDFPISEEGRRVVREFLAVVCTRFVDTIEAWFTTNRSQIEGPDSANCVGLNMFMYDVQRDASHVGEQLVAGQ
jgi:hypothetical protein